jgi:hypothetical protein
LQGIGKKLAAMGLAAALAACGKAPEPAGGDGFLPGAPEQARGCGENGYLETTIYGALEGNIRWSSGSLDCEGMPRPADAGARLRFAGLAGDIRVAFILAIPELERGSPGSELPSNVTLIEEGSGRFFSTAGQENCWSDIDENEPLPGTPDTFSIAGTLYCIAPLIEVNGDSSVSLQEMRFVGLLEWGDV